MLRLDSAVVLASVTTDRMPPTQKFLLVRLLAESDLGWFAALRAALNELGKGRQRAIQVNGRIISQVLTPEQVDAKEVQLQATCRLTGTTTVRVLNKSAKNWRIGGDAAVGDAFKAAQEDDILLGVLEQGGPEPLPFEWQVVMKAADRALHARVMARCTADLKDGMACFAADTVAYDDLLSAVGWAGAQPETPAAATRHNTRRRSGPSKLPVIPVHPVQRRKATVKERLRSPHILEEMLKSAVTFSSEAQIEFLEVIEKAVGALRPILEDRGWIKRVDREHKKLWPELRDVPIGFVDGGVGNLSMIGSAPVAIRVGSYIVRPGNETPAREQMAMENHLVDELYRRNGGVFVDQYSDVGALRDAARISLEAAGAVRATQRNPELQYLLLHGSLVSPASRYTDKKEDGVVVERFPSFSDKALEVLLPSEKVRRQGRDAQFVAVYLRQLELLAQSKTVVCGVVEREGTSRAVVTALFEALGSEYLEQALPDDPSTTLNAIVHALEQFRVSDVLLFHCLLHEGEYVVPFAIDRNLVRKAPNEWKTEISRIPKPWVTYLKAGEDMVPFRLEMFEAAARTQADRLARMVMHFAWLLPNYLFPAGLQVVDQHVKIGSWMTRPVNTHMAVSLFKSAMESGDPARIAAVRRMLSGGTRDWLFRPSF